MSLVLDASMTIAWLFEDERTEAVQAVMMQVVADSALVPSLWRLEVANMLRTAVRRNRCDDAFADRSLARLDRLRIRIDEETDRHAWGATRLLAREQGLTLYDAAYLELAVRAKCPLASCDGDLIAAAQRLTIDVLSR